MHLRSALATLALAALAPAAAHAQVTLTFLQSGADVDAQATGKINLTGLTFNFSGSGGPDYVAGLIASAVVGTSGASYVVYNGLTGPGSFGSGGLTNASSGSGSLFGIDGNAGANELVVPTGYTSGSSINGSAVFTNQSFSSLGLTPGTYTYTLPHDTVTVNIGAPVPAVPEPSTIASLGVGGLSLLGLVVAARRKRTAVQASSAL